VNSQTTIANDLIELVDAYLATIILLKGTPSYKPTIVYREDECLEQFGVASVERNIEEDLISVAGHQSPL
jgi:hypothetical protein